MSRVVHSSFFRPFLTTAAAFFLSVCYFNVPGVHAQNIRAGSDPVPVLLASATGLRQCYSFDGTGNNFETPSWGSVGEELVRPEGNNYESNSWHFMANGPNPRTVSNVMSHETCTDGDRTAETCINDWFWLWGQMIDHDMTHVPLFPKGVDNTTINVPVPSTDPFLAGRSLPMRRSAVTENSEQINLATAYLDASQIYGTSAASARRVRSLSGGRLLVTQDGFMPVIPARLRMDHGATPTFDELGHPAFRDQFLCADMRCNQHAPMAALQVMFVREHNRIASALAAARHPAYQTDEAIYQTARAMVIAMMQSITYREFLPLLMGRFGVAPYSGYKSNVPAGVSNAFTTAGFRTSHSMVRCEFRETTTTGQTLRAVNFATSFFDSTWIRGPPAQPNRANREANAYQSIMHALAVNPSARMDHRVAPSLRSVLFAPSTTAAGEAFPAMAFDVIASDIQRGRDHGLLDYRRMRRAQGWRDVGSVMDITADRSKQQILASLYPDINGIDLFAGMMLEDPLDGALTGPVTTSVVRDQFERARDGDRCWFENQFQGQLLTVLRGVRLRDLVDRNFANPPPVTTQNADGVAAAATSEGFSLLSRRRDGHAARTMATETAAAAAAEGALATPPVVIDNSDVGMPPADGESMFGRGRPSRDGSGGPGGRGDRDGHDGRDGRGPSGRGGRGDRGDRGGDDGRSSRDGGSEDDKNRQRDPNRPRPRDGGDSQHGDSQHGGEHQHDGHHQHGDRPHGDDGSHAHGPRGDDSGGDGDRRPPRGDGSGGSDGDRRPPRGDGNNGDRPRGPPRGERSQGPQDGSGEQHSGPRDGSDGEHRGPPRGNGDSNSDSDRGRGRGRERGAPDVDLRSWEEREHAGLTGNGVPGHRPRGGPMPPDTRPATAVDDVIGYRCDGSNDCEPVTFDDPLDPEIIAIAREIRDSRRAASAASTVTSFTPQGAPVFQQTQLQQTLDLSKQQQQRQVFGVHGAGTQAHPVFGTLRAEAGHATFHSAHPHAHSPALFGGLPHPRFFATLQNNNAFNNGVNNNNANVPIANLQPAPGIMQNVNRGALPNVPAAVLVENIFLTPQCRR